MKQILIVEDDHYLKFLYERTIREKFKYNVRTANTWRSGRIILFRQNFELVILDLMLPDCTGIKALEEIREKKPMQKVLIASAYCTKKNIMTLAQLKASGFIVKPFTMENLVSKISEILNLDI